MWLKCHNLWFWVLLRHVTGSQGSITRQTEVSDKRKFDGRTGDRVECENFVGDGNGSWTLFKTEENLTCKVSFYLTNVTRRPFTVWQCNSYRSLYLFYVLQVNPSLLWNLSSSLNDDLHCLFNHYSQKSRIFSRLLLLS